VSALAEQWFAQVKATVDAGDYSPGTARACRHRLDKQAMPALGALLVGEVTVGRVDRLLRATTERHGAAVASWCTAMTRRRLSLPANRWEAVFTSPAGLLRDPSNTQADLRDAFARVGHSGITSHPFRKTVGSLMDDAGLSARAAADQLGHAKVSMTQDRCGRRIRATGGAESLLTALAGSYCAGPGRPPSGDTERRRQRNRIHFEPAVPRRRASPRPSQPVADSFTSRRIAGGSLTPKAMKW
jgi:hypothetical protein